MSVASSLELVEKMSSLFGKSDVNNSSGETSVVDNDEEIEELEFACKVVLTPSDLFSSKTASFFTSGVELFPSPIKVAKISFLSLLFYDQISNYPSPRVGSFFSLAINPILHGIISDIFTFEALWGPIMPPA